MAVVAPLRAGELRFVDATAEVGLQEISYPADLRRAKMIAAMGGGAAWGDFDADGDLDLFVTQGVEKVVADGSSKTCGLLFRNDGGRFVERAAASGVRACGWGEGALFEDLDRDGDLDLFVTFYGGNQLWENRGDGTFVERAAKVGLRGAGFATGAAALDYDADGDLDLYVAHYVETTIEREKAASNSRIPLPDDYVGEANALFRNDGGTYTDVAAAAGVLDREHRGLAVTAADLDADGRTDLYVANDRSRSGLYRNRGDGTFEDATAAAGVGVAADKTISTAMGTAAGDLDGDGLPELMVANYLDEPSNIFQNLGDMVFADVTQESGIAEATYPWVGWGVEFADFDDDGRLDLAMVNGHLVPDWVVRMSLFLHPRERDLVKTYGKGGYAQPPLLFQGAGEPGKVRLRPIAWNQPVLAGRGLAAGDADLDGRLDLFLMSLSGKHPARLLLNRSNDPGHALQLELRPPGSTALAVGTVATVTPAGGPPQRRELTSGGSYLSASARPLHVGLGAATTAEVALRRPGGRTVVYRGLSGDHGYLLPGG